jgi:hypothetical protein
MYYRSCVLEGEALVDTEDLKKLSVSDILRYNWCHMMWSVHLLNFHDNGRRFVIHILMLAVEFHCNSASCSLEVMTTFDEDSL